MCVCVRERERECVCVCVMDGSPGVVVLSWMNQAELALHKVLV